MNILTLVTRIFGRQHSKNLHSVAILYPQKIIVATEHETVAGFSVASPIVSSLPTDISSAELGASIRNHLAQTKQRVPIPTDAKLHYRTFLDAAGLKNEKAHYVGARLLQIIQRGEEIIISPSVNGGPTGSNRGFGGHREITSTRLLSSVTDEELGDGIKAAWTRCRDNSA